MSVLRKLRKHQKEETIGSGSLLETKNVAKVLKELIPKSPYEKMAAMIVERYAPVRKHDFHLLTRIIFSVVDTVMNYDVKTTKKNPFGERVPKQGYPVWRGSLEDCTIIAERILDKNS